VKLRFLGTGTSFGIPVVGCDCAACTSADPRDRRSRSGALLTSDDGARVLLVDTPPELRLQLLAARVRHVDAVWITHCHADHIHGIDDLRVFSAHLRQSVPAYAPQDCAAVLRQRFGYIFDPGYAPHPGTTKPEISLHTLQPYRRLTVAGFDATPLPVLHGELRPLGFRIGELGYITDAKSLPSATVAALRGVRILVLNALWWGHSHPTHLNVEEAIDLAREIGAPQTFLTHLTHRLTHAELEARLPAGIAAAYDGLEVDVDE
jgi:phosphoribosyl 1,2-cyclic phosphate phosphodiesterase